jgi:radical SAM superfamily enzyme YgiQ (UPF0313 family)
LKIILLSVNASWTHSCLALHYLRNGIADLDYETEIIELTLKQTLSEALETIFKAKPDILCLSVYIWNVEYLKQLIPEIRKLLPGVKIVTGGPEITYNGKTADSLNPDILISGYGEQAFRKLAEKRFLAEDKVIPGEAVPLEQIDFPYIEADKAKLRGRMLYYEASRGCACRCIYCLSSRQEKQDWLSLQRVYSDINKLLALQPKVIKFVDRSFNQKREWARAIWQYVIKLETNIPFHFEIHPDWLEEQDFAILESAPPGRIQFEAGIQSIQPQTLSRIERPSDWYRVRSNLLELVKRTHIPLHTDLIAGLPGENRQQITESINEVLRILPTELQLGFLKILQGTAMAKTASEMGFVWQDMAPYTVLQTPDLSFEDMLHLEKISQIINQYYNKSDFMTVWKKAVAWREPYQSLTELLALNLSSDNQLHSIDMVKRFERMAGWIEHYWQGEEQLYLMDALKWDWCRKAGEAWYPPSLKGETALQFRKEHYLEIVDWLKSEYWQNEDWNLKRFIAFSAASNDFCNAYLEGYTKAVFVTCKGSVNSMVIYKSQY